MSILPKAESKAATPAHEAAAAVDIKRPEIAKLLTMRPRTVSSITAHPANATGRDVVAQVVGDQVKRIFPQLSHEAQEQVCSNLVEVLRFDPRFQGLVSKTS